MNEKLRALVFLTLATFFVFSCTKSDTKYDDLQLEKTSISLKEGSEGIIKIIAGSGEYSLETANSKIATAEIAPETKVAETVNKTLLVKVKALTPGETSIKVTDVKSKQVESITVTVTKKTMVDVAFTPESEVPDGVYVAFLNGGKKYAISSDGYSNKEGENTIIGALICSKGKRFVVSYYEIDDKIFISPRNIGDIEGVTTDISYQNIDEECAAIFNGRERTTILLKWVEEHKDEKNDNGDKKYKTDLLDEVAKYECAGLKNWYLLAPGELKILWDNKEEFNKIMQLVPEKSGVQLANKDYATPVFKYNKFYYWFGSKERFDKLYLNIGSNARLAIEFEN